MTTARQWRVGGEVRGPIAARTADIDALNHLFSEAFTERYRRDGMIGVRVPQLNPAIWRYAIRDAGGGALLWRGDRDEIVAFNVAHCSGCEGWMGPLAVNPEWQGSGLGKEIVRAGVAWLRDQGATVVGLETMPRTMDNIGFYSGLGFVPGRLTLTLTIDAEFGSGQPLLLSQRSPKEREDAYEACRRLTEEQIPGYDYTREMRLTADLGLGDTLLLERRGKLVGYALFHTAPLVEGRTREEVRVLKLVLRREEYVDEMARLLATVARASAAKRIALRVQGAYDGTYTRLIGLGARVRWTDLRMAVTGFAEPRATTGLVFSNWEI
jgi:GNAT superfamily N-acetyltransferase